VRAQWGSDDVVHIELDIGGMTVQMVSLVAAKLAQA